MSNRLVHKRLRAIWVCTISLIINTIAFMWGVYFWWWGVDEVYLLYNVWYVLKINTVWLTRYKCMISRKWICLYYIFAYGDVLTVFCLLMHVLLMASQTSRRLFYIFFYLWIFSLWIFFLSLTNFENVKKIWHIIYRKL